MEGLKLIETTVEYLYETKDLREKHIKLMEQEGWKDISGAGRRVKDGRSRVLAKEEDYEWYGCFIKSRKYADTFNHIIRDFERG
jgi:hypothetical protein